MIQLITPETEAEFDAVRSLCWAYRDVLLSLGGRDSEAVLRYYGEDSYRQLMVDLPRIHSAPEGALRLALKDGEPVGCGMMLTLSPGLAEIKRVYVDAAARGTGLGRRIMVDLIDTCRTRGFNSIVMDTGRKLTAANGLYRDLGFKTRGPYSEVPEELEEVLVFYEMVLVPTP